ncbi:MAG: imidazolonepropionase [Acidimicrobiia bacterium]|nr:imidazolonepropionase [Acidimicrobiia bacterium]
MTDLLLTGIGHLVTNTGEPGDTAPVLDAAVAITDGKIEWVGATADADSAETIIDLEGRAVLPGLVDAHTHIVYAGSRAEEFAKKLAGESYEAILAAGGGIMDTVRSTRIATNDQLMDITSRRLGRMAGNGTTTVETKSGYGLDVETEVRILKTAALLAEESGVEVVCTFLGAHVVPTEYRVRRDAYVDLVIEGMIPECASHAEFIDVFCDRGAFDLDETRAIIEAGIAHGLRPRLHAEQLANTGAVDLGVEMGAISLDHLDHVTPEQAAKMGEAGTIAVLVPGVTLQMRTPPPDVASLRRAGVTLALASDANPGTSNVELMTTVIALGSLLFGMSVEESVWAATRGGALALDRGDRGQVVAGSRADLVVLMATHPAHLAYRIDQPVVYGVIMNGEIRHMAGSRRLI